MNESLDMVLSWKLVAFSLHWKVLIPIPNEANQRNQHVALTTAVNLRKVHAGISEVRDIEADTHGATHKEVHIGRQEDSMQVAIQLKIVKIRSGLEELEDLIDQG